MGKLLVELDFVITVSWNIILCRCESREKGKRKGY